MKRAVAFSFFLACCGVLLGNPTDARGPSRESASLLDDVVRLTRDGLSDETVLAYAKTHRGELPPVVTNERLLWLRQSGVSETVIRYLRAIDVRPSDESAAEDAAYDSDEGARYSTAVYSSPGNDYDSGDYDRGDYDRGDYDRGDYDRGDYDSGDYGSGSYDSYPDSDYASYYGDYPFYGGAYYSYPAYFFVNRGFFGRFHRRGHDFQGHRGDIGNRRGSGRPGFPRDHRVTAGFDRGSQGRRGGVVVGQGWRERSARPRGNWDQGFRQPRGVAIGRDGPGRSAFPRRSMGQVSRGPRGGVIGNGAFGRPGFSGGSRPGGAVGRAPIGRSGGGSRSMARPGGHGKR